MGSLSAEMTLPEIAEYGIADMKRLPGALFSGSGNPILFVKSSAAVLANIVKVRIVRIVGIAGIAADVHDDFSVCND